MILSSIDLRKVSCQRILFLFLMAAAVVPSTPVFAENGLWNTTKVQLEAVANQEKEWDLRPHLADPMKLPKLDLAKQPEGFSLVSKKVKGTDSIVLKGKYAKVGQLPAFIVMASDAAGKSSVLTIELAVRSKSIVPTAGQGGQPPAWTERPINLNGARAGEAFAQQSVSGYARDPDPGDTLTFSWQGGEKWILVSPDGTITAKDGKVPVNKTGTNGANIRVTDKAGNYDEVIAYVEVQGANEAPRWEVDGEPLAQIKLRDAELGKEMNQDISIYAHDPDGVKAPDFFVYEKSQAPWFQIRADGLVNGEPPANTPVGEYKVVLGVTDGTDSAYVIARGKVGPPNNSPTFAEPIKITVKERSTFDKTLVGDPYVTDADGDALEFTLTKPAPVPGNDFKWINLSSSGQLVINAPHELNGKTFDFPFTVTDNRISAPLEGTLQITILRDPLPPRWIKQFPSTLQALANVPFEHDLKGYVQDDEGLDVTFEVRVTSGPKWLLVDKGPQDPRLHGRPDEDDAGTETKATIVAKNSFGAASAGRNFTIKVGGGNRKPVWVKGGDGNVTLRKAKADEVYQRHLLNPKAPEKPVVSDPDTGDKVASFKFTQVDPNNAWAYVNPQGLVFGDPSLIANARTAELEVIAFDTKGASETARVVIPLGGAASPPSWDMDQADPITSLFVLEDVKVGSQVSFDVSKYVKDADDDPKDLFYRIKSIPPAWLSIVGKTPQLDAKPPAGTATRPWTVVIEVSDDETNWVDAGFTFKTIPAGGGGGENMAPEFQMRPVKVTGKAGTAFTVNLKSDTYVKDANGDDFIFGFATGGQLPEWLSMSPAGLLEIRASAPVGVYERSIRVTETKTGGLSATEVLEVTITQGGGGGGNVRPPIWIKESIADGPLVLRSGEQTTIQLVGEEAANRPGLEHLGLFFGKSTTACNLGWVTVSRQGELKIAPLPTTTGSFTCEIIASNDPTFGTAGRQPDINRDSVGILRVTVTEPVSGSTHVVQLGKKPTTKSAVDILFVVDNEAYNGTSVNAKYFSEFKTQGIKMMRNLDSWNVAYNIAFISARDMKGRFLAPSGMPIILKSSNPDRELEFSYRVDCTRSNLSSVSPTLALGGFNDNVDGLYPTIVGNEFLKQDVPLMVVIVSHKPDKFATLYPDVVAANRPVPTSQDAARMLFDRLSVRRKKPMVVYVQDGTCLTTGAKQTTTYDHYLALSRYNYGLTYTPKNCDAEYVTPILEELSNHIAFQAYRFSHYTKNFESVNYSTDRLRVFIERGTNKAVELQGNTGASDDQWSFGKDSSGRPRLWINWWNIRMPYDPDTDRLVIKY